MSKKQILSACVAISVLVAITILLWWIFSNKDQANEITKDITEEVLVDQAELKIFTNSVEILTPGENDWKEGLDGAAIVAGTRIRTNNTGRGEIVFPGGSVTRIDHNSEIMIEIMDQKESNFVINLTKGKIWSRVSKILGKISYETKTSRTVATVRGTEYGHEILEDFDRIVVAESKVDVKCTLDTTNTLVIDVQLSDWSCLDGKKPQIVESSIDKLILDEWYKFNLQEIHSTIDQTEPTKVLGETDEPTSLSTPRTIATLIDCVGPDGKTAKSTRKECDSLWDYWNKNPPPTLTPQTNTIDQTTPTPTKNPTPTPTPRLFTLSSANCDSYYGCFSMDINGTGFATGIRIKAKDSNGVMTEGLVTINDANNLYVDFQNYSLCYGGVSPYQIMAFYVDGVYQTISGFTPSFCAIIN